MSPSQESPRARAFVPLERFAHDLRFGVRLMRRSPVFTVVAVLTLALGIGANTAIFSLVDIAFLRPLPVPDAGRLVVLDAITKRGEEFNVSYPLFARIEQEADVFSGVFAALDGVNRVPMIGAGSARQSEEVVLQLVSGAYFEVLRAVPHIGRTFTTHDDRARVPVAVLSHAFWKRRFGSDPNAVGKNVTLQNQSFTIVGVARPGFFGEAVGRAPDIWVPLTMQPAFDRGASLLDRPNVGWLRIIGRLRPDRTREDAAAVLDVLLERFHSDPTDIGAGHLARIDPVDGSHGVSHFRDRYSSVLQILTGVVGILLLIACANLAGLLLVRAAGRQREVAVRLALGAGRMRLIRQFLTESLLLGVLGGVLGLFVAWWGTGVLLVLASGDAGPIAIDVTPNIRTLVITTCVSLGTVIVIGLAPALTASRLTADPSLRLRMPARGRPRISAMLVSGQIALSLLLLMGAGMFVQTFRHLRTRDLGFASDVLLQVEVQPERSGYAADAVPALMRQLVERLRALPGVAAAGQAQTGFRRGMPRTCCIAVEGYQHHAGEDRQIETVSVAPGYFRTLGLPLLRGRDFAPQEAIDDPRVGPKVAIVNEAFAQRFFGNEPAVGKRFGWGTPPGVSYGSEIVGVARNANYGELREPSKPLVYYPAWSGALLTIRAAGAPAELITTVRREIQRLDEQLEISHLGTISSDVERALVRESLLATLSTFFAILAAGLAALGVYGLMAHAVASRTRAIGIRMALGAPRASVLRAELVSAGRLVASGVVIGMSAAYGAARLVMNQLYGVSATDPAVLVSAIALLATVAGVSAYLPARRAARVDPAVVLRHD